MKQLKVLDLFNCDVTEEELYREKVFKMIPQLQYLDGLDQQENEAVDSDEDGKKLDCGLRAYRLRCDAANREAIS